MKIVASEGQEGNETPEPYDVPNNGDIKVTSSKFAPKYKGAIYVTGSVTAPDPSSHST